MKCISDSYFHIHLPQLTLHGVEANTTEYLYLLHTANTHTFHDLTPNTAYSVTITAVNKAGNGPTVSVTVTTQGTSMVHR